MSEDRTSMLVPTFGQRYMTEPLPKYSLPEKSMNPKAAYHLIHDELQVQGNPTLNMASFVTTVMDEEADRLRSRWNRLELGHDQVLRNVLAIKDLRI